MQKKILSILFTLILSAVLYQGFFYNPSNLSAQAQAPAVTITGDDLAGNGGTDDAYDSLIVFDITAGQATPDFWELEYSVNNGASWNILDADYNEINVKRRTYYWSVSGLYAPNLGIRIRTQDKQIWSDYFTAELSLYHRVTNPGASYFVEDFLTTTYQDPATEADWNTTKGYVMLDVLDAWQASTPEVAYWNFDEGLGTVLNDVSRNGHNSSRFEGNPQWVAGKFGGAMQFDGVGDRIFLTDSPLLQFDDDDFTISIWLESDLYKEQMPAFGRGYYYNNKPYAGSWSITNISFPETLYFSASDGQQEDLNIMNNFTNYNWTHVAVKRDDGRLTAWVNGQQVDQANNVNGDIDIGNRELRFGGRDAAIYGWAGKIDETKIFDYALTDNDIRAMYKSAFEQENMVYSKNLISGSDQVLSVTVQPIHYIAEGLQIQYQFSNNGVDWFGNTGGNPSPNSWFTFTNIAPPAVIVSFGDTVGSGLYWRAKLATNNVYKTPRLYQLKFLYEKNTVPQACFTVSPTRSDEPEENFIFNAECSSDFEDALNNLDFRWDWENDGTFDTSWQTGFQGYSKTHIFSSTSTFDINLEVRDNSDSVDDYLNTINQEGVEGSISGWAWSSNYGWISLNCDNTYYGTEIQLCSPSYGWQMNADYTMSGWAWDSNLGWLCLGSTCAAYGNDPVSGQAPTANYSRATGEVNGWAKFLSYDQSGWLSLRGAWCGLGEDQCVHINFSRRAMEGYGWAGGRENGIAIGPGWVTFQGSLNVPWLETTYGRIYSRSDVGSTESAVPPDSRYSASYCILSSGNIINFVSEIGCTEAGYSDLGFPSVANKYRTINGVINFENILNGNESEYNSADVDVNLPNILAGKVYSFVTKSSYTIDKPITFYNAQNLNSSGAGTIVIDGDLYIKSNLYYQNSSVNSKIENLANIAWIVKGDVFIDPSVSEIVGNFIVLGKVGIACPTAGCGHFKTGSDLAAPKQLVIRGLVMSKQISFERSYKQSGEPAEKIIYDGRILINTPPGLSDVAKGLPVWREAFSTSAIE